MASAGPLIDPHPLFELSRLDFPLPSSDESVDFLPSYRLALVAFHPEATSAQQATAREVFMRRREEAIGKGHQVGENEEDRKAEVNVGNGAEEEQQQAVAIESESKPFANQKERLEAQMEERKRQISVDATEFVEGESPGKKGKNRRQASNSGKEAASQRLLDQLHCVRFEGLPRGCTVPLFRAFLLLPRSINSPIPLALKRTANGSFIAAFRSDAAATAAVDIVHDHTLPPTNARISTTRLKPRKNDFQRNQMSTQVQDMWKEKEELPAEEALWVEKGTMANEAFRISREYDEAFDKVKERWSTLRYAPEQVNGKGVAPLVEMAADSLSPSPLPSPTVVKGSEAGSVAGRYLLLLLPDVSDDVDGLFKAAVPPPPQAPPPPPPPSTPPPPAVERDLPPHLRELEHQSLHQRQPQQQSPPSFVPRRPPVSFLRDSIAETFRGSAGYPKGIAQPPTLVVPMHTAGGIEIDSHPPSSVGESQEKREEGKKRPAEGMGQEQEGVERMVKRARYDGTG